MQDYCILDRLSDCIERFPERQAFFIEGRSWSYREFGSAVSAVQAELMNHTGPEEQNIAILSYDDIHTYASIYACWFSGKTMVPVNPRNPAGRNEFVLKQTHAKTILSAKDPGSAEKWIRNLRMIITGGLSQNAGKPIKKDQDPAKDYYILFTSGSSGLPKGVRITGNNLNSFVRDFLGYGYRLNEEDRFLQIYDLTFDASVHCYTVPLSIGASVYTVSPESIKYLTAYKLMKEHQLSFVKMPPSTLSYLKPYFSTIRLERLRYCLLGGEAFPVNLALEWQKCVPGALIQNVYGPTEATINCLIYDWNDPVRGGKEHKGIVSIGKCFGENKMLVTDEKGNAMDHGKPGELCVAGPQISPGYLNNPEKNRASFFEKEGERYYRTGDVVHLDEEGDVMFSGRKDFQVQINGYRVELGEIEMHARNFLKTHNVVAAGVMSREGTTHICLFTELPESREEELRSYLVEQLPEYMVPRQIINVESMPKTPGGKINRSELIKKVSNDQD